MNQEKKGFTLIELLVVIAIIGILAAIGLFALNGAREKSRDSKRESDLSSMKTTIALYYDGNDSLYPAGDDSSSNGGAWSTLDTQLVPAYTGALPVSGQVGNTTTEKTYSYVVAPLSDHYLLYTQLEANSNGLTEPIWYINDRGISATVDNTTSMACASGVNAACP